MMFLNREDKQMNLIDFLNFSDLMKFTKLFCVGRSIESNEEKKVRWVACSYKYH